MGCHSVFLRPASAPVADCDAAWKQQCAGLMFGTVVALRDELCREKWNAWRCSVSAFATAVPFHDHPCCREWNVQWTSKIYGHS